MTKRMNRPAVEVDPRACGVNQTVNILFVDNAGRSPRMRGKRWQQIEVKVMEGSIPAHAG